MASNKDKEPEVEFRQREGGELGVPFATEGAPSSHAITSAVQDITKVHMREGEVTKKFRSGGRILNIVQTNAYFRVFIKDIAIILLPKAYSRYTTPRTRACLTAQSDGMVYKYRPCAVPVTMR